MTAQAFYNENDPFAAAWLRELIKAGCIAPGEVDERSIEDIRPSELAGFTQCHFFAGIGIWSYALRAAEWPDDRAVWTGSCPCQPFSAAGKRHGTSDERHLWPALFHLIQQLQPSRFFGEQVGSKDGLAWFDLVQSDLEGAGYTTGAFDLCAAGFGAPHIRQRLYFVADSGFESTRRSLRRSGQSLGPNDERTSNQSGRPSVDGGRMADSSSQRRQQIGGSTSCNESSNGRQQDSDHISSGNGADSLLADPSSLRCLERRGASGASVQRQCSERSREYSGSEQKGQLSGRPEGIRGTGVLANPELHERRQECPDSSRSREGSGAEGLEQRSLHSGLVNGAWAGADWIYCRDEKYRPVEAGTFPLAHGIANRVGKLRGYGNAIVAPVATAFIESYLEVEADMLSK